MREIALFQDDSGDSIVNQECVGIFREYFPLGSVFLARSNIGVALNYDRAERWVFDSLGADLGFFFEDDLLLSPQYLSALKQMAQFALADERIAYVSAYGDHELSADAQQMHARETMPLSHKWGFALTQRQWREQKPIVDAYLDLIKDHAYNLRDHIAIWKHFERTGYSSMGTSQDAAKDVASCVLGTVKLNTVSCYAKYIGADGLHFTSNLYEEQGYGKTVLASHAPSIEKPSDRFLDNLINRTRSDGRIFMESVAKTKDLRPKYGRSDENYVYFGNLFPSEIQYKSGKFIGLAHVPQFDRDILHDIRQPLPFKEGTVEGFQSQDVFEHVRYDEVIKILDDIYRCLKPGGMFRLSVPDYHCPVLRRRSVFDYRGNVLYDVMMGGTISLKPDGGLKTTIPENGGAHLWFPTYQNLSTLIIESNIRNCRSINFHHYWIDANEYVVREFDQSLMPVTRSPPSDNRAEGKPISIVVDFIK